LYYLEKAPKEYSATSTLLIKVMSKENSDDFDLPTSPSMNTVAQHATRIEFLTKVVSLPEVRSLEGIIPPAVNWYPEWSSQWLGIGKEESENLKSLEPVDLAFLIRSWTSVSVRKHTRLLDITVSHQNPEVCKVLADAIATEYVAELSDIRIDDQESSSRILVQKFEEARDKLEKRQEALANCQTALNALSQLEEKEVIFSNLDRKHLPIHPDHREAKDTLSEFQKRFLAEFVDVREAAVDLEYWEAHRAKWDQVGLDTNSQLQIAKRLLSARATVLKSEIVGQERIYNAILKKLMGIIHVKLPFIEAPLEISNLALRPGSPSSPQRGSVIMTASIGGLGAGLALAFLLSRPRQ
jgi:uncharacterized protein involved in exopolysaccharide biosynthesis